MSADTDRLIKALHRIGDGIYELEETMCRVEESIVRIEDSMWTRTKEAGRVSTIAGLMFNSGYALDRLKEISQALQEIQKHNERNR